MTDSKTAGAPTTGLPSALVRRAQATVAALLVAVVLAACSSGTTRTNGAAPTPTTGASGAARTVDITMVDLAYQPNTPISVPLGTTVHFVLQNHGATTHEAFIGDQAEQDGHDKEMLAMGSGSSMNMNGPNEVDLTPGATATLTYTFTKAGTFLIGCHYPGHYAAGMHIAITVT